MKTKVTILNAAAASSEFDRAVRKLAQLLGAEETLFNLAEMDIRFCTGCWDCWWKTPGRCMFKDDMETVLPAVLESGLLLIATPIFLSMPAALMKKTLDRCIPLIHPYIELIHGESHHRKRYANYPSLALYAKSNNNGADYALLDKWFSRFALNFHGPVVFSSDDSNTPKQVADALDRL